MYTLFFSVYMIMHNHVYTNTVKFKIVSQKLLYVPQYLQSSKGSRAGLASKVIYYMDSIQYQGLPLYLCIGFLV